MGSTSRGVSLAVRYIAIAHGGAGGGFPGRGSWGNAASEIPHDEIFETAKRGLHRAALLRNLEAAQPGQAGLFEQAHHGGSTGLGHHIGQCAGILGHATAHGSQSTDRASADLLQR